VTCKYLIALATGLITASVHAHQPVMDMAPRWQNGWGFQIRHEIYDTDRLLDGDSEISNTGDREKSINKTWLEGIYTFRREVRLTFKLPTVDQSRTIIRNGVRVRESGSGIGDLIIALPLKRYQNKENSTGNIAITPSIRLPTGNTDDDFAVGDGSTDFGVSFSASFERADLYQYYDLFYWANGDGDKGFHQGDAWGLDINVGWHPYHHNETNTGVFLMLDLSARHERRGQDTAGITGGDRLSVGPVFVWYRGGMMLRAEFKTPLYEKLEAVQLSRGNEFSIGIGFVF